MLGDYLGDVRKRVMKRLRGYRMEFGGYEMPAGLVQGLRGVGCAW